jgi:hypothetical protein
VDAADVVVHEEQAHHRRVVSDFLLKAFVSRVNRRIDIRIVRFARSTKDVLTGSGSGEPETP